MENSFNERFRQIVLFMIIVIIAVLLIFELTIFLPGFLGGVTLYILSRSLYFQCIFKYKWKKGLTALLFIFAFIFLIAIPIFIGIELVSPKIRLITDQQDKLIQGIQIIADKIKAKTGMDLFTADNAKETAAKISAFVPQLLNLSLIHI